MGIKPRLSISHLHEEKNLSFLDHLEELRYRLILCVVAIGLGMIGGLVFAKPVNEILIMPFQESNLVYKAAKNPDLTTLQLRVDSAGKVLAIGGLQQDDSVGSGTIQVQRLEFFREGESVPFAKFEGSSVPGAGHQPSSLAYLRPTDPFSVYFKTAFIIGLVLALPFLVYQLYAFVAPGLMPRERQAIVPLFLMAGILFPIGAGFAFFLMKYMIYFLMVYALPDVMIFNDIKAYLSFASIMILAFGCLFELPVVVVLLTRLGIVSVDTLAAKRKFIFIGILVVSAVVIPGGDPFTLIGMTLPLYILFELALVMSRIGSRKRELAAQELAEESKS